MSDTSELLTRAVEQVTPRKLAEEKLASGKPMRIYWGIDPTGARIHLGHAVPLRKMKALADAGHEVIMLIGSFTAMIGDPSGRDAMRQVLTREDVDTNFQLYKEQASKILDFSKVEITYNHEWLEQVTFEDIIKMASNFTVQQMLERDMFEKRMNEGNPIRLHEFFYPLMVGYDSVVLDVDCEIGGSDQYFNMLAGRTLQQAYGKRDKFVLTTKLLEGTDGRKMSKTYDNCVYLDDEPNEMYGKLMRIRDDLILTYMECATDLPMDQVQYVKAQMEKGTNPKEFKMAVAFEVTRLYHGTDSAKHAEDYFKTVFQNKETPMEMPEVKAKPQDLLMDIVVGEGLVASKSEYRRLVEQGGLKAEDSTVKDANITVGDCLPQDGGVVKVGKRKFLRIMMK